jgi:hypothetical protein
MTEQEFIQLLRDYPEALADRRRFLGLLKDLLPGMTLQINLLLNSFDLNIQGEIEKVKQIDNAFYHRFVKLMLDDFGTSQNNAEWAVATWCACYGEGVLGKEIEVDLNRKMNVDAEPKPTSKPALTPKKAKPVMEDLDEWGDEFSIEQLREKISELAKSMLELCVASKTFRETGDASQIIEALKGIRGEIIGENEELSWFIFSGIPNEEMEPLLELSSLFENAIDTLDKEIASGAPDISEKFHRLGRAAVTELKEQLEIEEKTNYEGLKKTSAAIIV